MHTVQTLPGERPSVFWTPLRSRARWPLVAATLVAAAAHGPVIAPHLAEAPYMGEEFIVLTAACLGLSIAAAACDSLAVYLLVASTCGLAVLGYLATRSVAFPDRHDDVGNCLEPLGVVCAAAEMLAVGLAVAAVWSARRSRARSRAGAGTPTCAPASYAVWSARRSQARSRAGAGTPTSYSTSNITMPMGVAPRR
ncbi:MAG: hypothetical protein ACR2F6_02910 [Mycobacteriales bacterium]